MGGKALRGSIVGTVLLSFILIFASLGSASSCEQFIAPVDGGRRDVAGLIREGPDGIIEAENAQDGFNYASNAVRSAKGGFRQVLFPSGFGYTAGATECYEVFEDPNAAQQRLRQAYFQAFIKAKAELTRGLRGLQGRGREILEEHIVEIDLALHSAYKPSSQCVADLEQVIEGLVCGYVVYEVDHDPQNQEVYVAVVTTPRTASTIANLSDFVVSCTSIDYGIDYVIRQISYGVIPPIGGKLITVPATGEVALISFGSEIIPRHENPTVEETYSQAAQRTAAISAKDAMIKMINGPSRSGHLPVGVASQIYSNGSWIYVVNVYLPNAVREARRCYEEMQKVGLDS